MQVGSVIGEPQSPCVLAPQRWIEPRTNWLTANYSTAELLRNDRILSTPKTFSQKNLYRDYKYYFSVWQKDALACTDPVKKAISYS